nr:uncharacterized protein CI109_002500 [Kwoniella shandongensis]KAA5529159.1 hypothetical protein CI109_002500 [Kwoniella shandongensis]
MLLANYASDSGSDSESETPAKPAPPPAAAAAAPKPSTSGVKGKKRGGPIKITLDLPKTSNGDDREGDGEEDEDDRGLGKNKAGVNDGERDAKRAKLPKGGKGSSMLVGMLPPPKRKLPTASTSTSKASSLAVNKSMATSASSSSSKPIVLPSSLTGSGGDDDDDEDDAVGRMLPPSVKRGLLKKKKEEELDLFGLSTTTPTPSVSSIPNTSLKPPSISSAPLAPDYVPPPPTSTDPYPGYYQLPSGEWRAYDPEYYHSFFSTSHGNEEDEDGSDGRVGKHWDEYESGQFGGSVLDIDANKGLEEARKEEERKGLMKKPTLPGDEFEYKPTGQVKGLAAQRHQLSSLLNTAYTQREELEQRIAANKKSMRAAGQKYGF